MPTWEYKVAVIRSLNNYPATDHTEDAALAAALDTYGRKGWELVAVTGHTYQRPTDPTAMYGYTLSRYHFKRPIGGAKGKPVVTIDR